VRSWRSVRQDWFAGSEPIVSAIRSTIGAFREDDVSPRDVTMVGVGSPGNSQAVLELRDSCSARPDGAFRVQDAYFLERGDVAARTGRSAFHAPRSPSRIEAEPAREELPWVLRCEAAISPTARAAVALISKAPPPIGFLGDAGSPTASALPAHAATQGRTIPPLRTAPRLSDRPCRVRQQKADRSLWSAWRFTN
jgi:hypothetical protein